ncbi:hypothetical protein ACN09X_05135 [Aliarcobacter butzleri]|uniref:hypothetical protein n=1 Tax=Aliarcobacter butzleri TaxID=28197 RepID=UPI003ADE3E8D
MKSIDTISSKLFNNLTKNYLEYKIDAYVKDSSREIFIQKILQAEDNIYLFGMNFQNYFTKNNSILEAFKQLDKEKKKINIYIYIPNEDVLKEIESYIIYEKKNLFYLKNRNLLKIINNRFNYLDIKVIVYNKFYKFGASAIDLNTKNAFLHLSKVNRKEYIGNSSFFNLVYNDYNKLIIEFIYKFFKKIEKSGKEIK